MEITLHKKESSIVAEIGGEGVLLRDAQSALDLIATARHEYDADKLVLHAENIADEFFELRNGVLGEVLQKFVNYGAALAVVGDITPHTMKSKSLRDFVGESNRGGRILFVDTLGEALAALHRIK